MSKRWMSSGYLKAAPSGRVDRENGIIEGVSVCTVGEAKGHGVNLDQEFVDTVAQMGGSRKQGLKARFGHPNMCSTALGTFIGRFKNFRTVNDRAVADLFLSNEAKDTPHGDLHSYVLGMAENEPDMFGTSIVFTPGRAYRRDIETGAKVYEEEFVENGAPNLSDELFIECDELHACDAVDDPAANDGLFSRFSQETLAGQITEFLDLHPQVWDAVQENPSIIEALGRYGDKVDEFVSSYRAYREHNGEGHTMTDERTDSEQSEQASVTEPEATETLEAAEEAEEVSELAAESDAVEAFQAESEQAEPDATLTAERDALKALLVETEQERDGLEQEAEENGAKVEQLTKELSEAVERAVRAEAERDELGRKLAAIEQGAERVSAAPAPESNETPWEKAVAAGRKKS